MANLLYVTCNVRPQDKSRTLSLGNEFLEEYIRWNPKEEVQVLDSAGIRTCSTPWYESSVGRITTFFRKKNGAR